MLTIETIKVNMLVHLLIILLEYSGILNMLNSYTYPAKLFKLMLIFEYTGILTMLNSYT